MTLRFVTDRLGHGTINLPTKFEVPNLPVTEILKAMQNVEKWGGFGWLVGTQACRQYHHSIEHIRLPIPL